MGSQRTASSNIRISSTGNFYYTAYTTTASYVEKAFGFGAQRLRIVYDGNDTLDYSWDGSTLAGSLYGGEWIELHPSGRTSVYLRETAGNSGVVRITAE